MNTFLSTLTPSQLKKWDTSMSIKTRLKRLSVFKDCVHWCANYLYVTCTDMYITSNKLYMTCKWNVIDLHMTSNDLQMTYVNFHMNSNDLQWNFEETGDTHCPKLIFYPIQIWQVFNNISGLLMLNTSDISKEKRKLSGVLLENTI